MLRLAQWRIDRGLVFRTDDNTCRGGVLPAAKRIHHRLLVTPVALHTRNLGHPHRLGRTLQATRIPPLMKARLAHFTGSSVVPFGK